MPEHAQPSNGLGSSLCSNDSIILQRERRDLARSFSASARTRSARPASSSCMDSHRGIRTYETVHLGLTRLKYRVTPGRESPPKPQQHTLLKLSRTTRVGVGTWPLHDILITNIVLCAAYTREVERGVVYCPTAVQ